MKVRIYIKLKEGILDIEGKTIESFLNGNLGFDQINNVRKGKLIEMDINEPNSDKRNKIIEDICDKMLVNQVIENYEII